MDDDGLVIDYNKDHHEWRAAMGIGSVLIEMKRTGYTNGDPARIAEWHNFLKVHVWEKWSYPTKDRLKSNTNRYTSNLATKQTWFTGRLAVAAMALDYTHSTPGKNEYYEWLNSPTSSFGRIFDTYIGLINAKDYRFPSWSDDDSSYLSDTSHINAALYPILLGKMMGYTFN